MENEWNQHWNLNEESFTWPFRKDIEIPNMLNLTGKLKGKAVFDYGCGAGNYTRLFKMNGADRVVGFDISEEMITHAISREEKEQLGIVYTSSLNSELNGQFDLVLNTYVLPYAFNKKDLHTICCNMSELLRPGGRLIVVTHNPNFNTDPHHYEAFNVRTYADPLLRDEKEIYLELGRSPRWNKFKICYWSAAGLETALKEAGFCQIHWRKLTVYGPCPVADAPENVRDFIANPVFAFLECYLPE